MIKNVEIKAKIKTHDFVTEQLKKVKAKYVGMDNQTDIYFKSENGRLKLRTGNIENNLIYYQRPDKSDIKTSKIELLPLDKNKAEIIKKILQNVLGVSVTVRKLRQIWFLNHIKIHIDKVEGLGKFVEIEVIDESGNRDETEMRAECEALMRQFQIEKADLESHSYSDLLLSASV